MDALEELIIDSFAGGGGVSEGARMVFGRSPHIAINHDIDAIKMHKVNHPDCWHYIEDIWTVDPTRVCKGRPVGLFWLSPDCTHFSKAKGASIQRSRKIRGLAWVGVWWAKKVRPRILILENVEEFVTWGPLKEDGTPDPAKKGQYFQNFVNALKKEGYKVEWRVLKACDYGSPTSRKRFFLIARCDGKPIVWPTPTHGNPKSAMVKSGNMKPWRTAAEIIDWSIDCPSIFDRKKPLAENTLRRIAKGLKKFIIENPCPYIIEVNHGGSDNRVHGLDEPLNTILGKNSFAIVSPIITRHFGQSIGHCINEPLATITAGGGGKSSLVTAFLSTYYGETSDKEVRGNVLNEPLRTITAGGNRHAIVTSHIIKLRNKDIGQPVTEPLHTITAGGLHHGEVRTFMLKYLGGDKDSINNLGLIVVNGEVYQIVDIGMRMLEPHELFAAQGFPNTYIIDRDYEGKKYPKNAQVARCGNSVPPQLPKALIEANLPEYSISTQVNGPAKTAEVSRESYFWMPNDGFEQLSIV